MSDILARFEADCPCPGCNDPFQLAAKIFNSAFLQLKEGPRGDAAFVEEIVAMALKLFDEYDIPGVGPVLEKFMKAVARGPLEVAIRKAAEWLDSLVHPVPTPTPTPPGPNVNVTS